MTSDTAQSPRDPLAREALEQLMARLRNEMQPELVRDAQQLLHLASELEGVGLAALEDHDRRWLSVRSLAHRLAGSVGTLGFRSAGAAAVELENLTSGKPRPDPEEWAELWRQAMELASLLDQAPGAERRRG